MDLEDITTIAVLGAGTMGHGIAEVAALAGYDVTLRDIEEDLVQQGYDQIEWSLGKLAEKDRIDPTEVDAALDRIAPVVDLDDAVSDADFVIEAVPERMDIKRTVYADVEEHAPDRAIFATNTSSLSITEISEVTDRPERFCGMHFFNPPVRMELVEVIAGGHTDESTLELTEALAESLGKTPVRVHKDRPGFIVNRILVPLINEAGWILHSGDADIEAVESTAKYDMGLPMGVFELADQIGIDVGVPVLEYMNEVLGAAYEPCPLLEEKVEAEELGKKTGIGFFDYESGDGAAVPADAGEESIRRRLLAVMANEVAKLLDDDIADVDAIDRAVTLGAGFPEGPVTLSDEYGLEPLLETLEELRARTDSPRYEPNAVLRERAKRGGFRSSDGDQPTEFRTLRVEHPGDHVARLVIDRAHRMNTITLELLDELETAVEGLEADEAVRAILLVGDGDRAFSAGADVQGLAAGGADAFSAMELSRSGQRAFARLEASDLPVVAGIDGFCLGGGMELAASADLRIASERSQLGQPEHNLGLLPGWGGTQRLRHIVGEGRAKEIIFTGDRYDADTMYEYGFVNEVVTNEKFEDRALELAADLAAGPPIAQRLTKRAMLVGRGDMDAGLEVEASAFGHLVGTEDLVEGISAFMEDRDPTFEGK